MWDSVLVNKAIFFAGEKHKGHEMFNPVGMPYSAHYFGVALNAIKFAAMTGENIDWDLLLCSSILHDTLEDTTATYEELESNFGKEIAQGVLALTKNPNLPYEEQMPDSLKRIRKQPKEIAIVKMADRMFNMRDRVPTWPKDKQEAYKKEAQMICDALGELCGDEMTSSMQEQLGNY